MARFGRETNSEIPKTPEVETPVAAPAPVKKVHPKENDKGMSFGGECTKCHAPIYAGENAITVPQGMVCKNCKPKR